MNGKLTDLSDLLKRDRLFEIPIYQRGYAWEEENLQDLWDDLYYLGDRKHYFGTILLKADRTTEAGMNTFEVIDGQQRLTTILILLRELIYQLKKLGDHEAGDKAATLNEDYIGRAPHYRLTIGNEDEFFFRESILARKSVTAPETRAQERLRTAQSFFCDQFHRQREAKGQDEYRSFLIDFNSRRIERLQVMQYIVPSNAEAVRMFETVNDRGRPLTNLEKTKSILMYVSYLVVDDPVRRERLFSELNGHFAKIYQCFHDTEEKLGLRDAGEIQRYHHVFFFGQRTLHKHMQVLKDRLMEMSREDREDCERFIRRYARSLRQAFGTMQGIARRRRDGSALGRAIDRLFMVGPVGNLYPLLIAAWQEVGEDSEREEILCLFEAFVIRVYRVVRRRSHTGRSTLNWLAYHVHRSISFSDLRQRLRKLNLDYVTDDRFRRELSGAHCYSNLGTGTIKYLLAEYEVKRQKEERGGVHVPLGQILSSEYETEHILPQHPAGGLNEEERAAHQEIVHRLGNLTIALKECNRRMGNRPFEEKRDGWGEPDEKKICYYRNSSLRVQRDLAKYEQWNESTIEERGEEIIDFALKRWQVGPVADPRTDSPQP